MGFFSDLLPELPTQEIQPSDKQELHKKKNVCMVDGVKVIALSDKLEIAKEYIKNHTEDKDNPCIVLISGNRHSGKSLLAKAIMISNQIDHSEMDLRSFERATGSTKLFKSFSGLSEGVILEGYDIVQDKELLDCVKEFLNSKTEIRIPSDRKYVSPIIIPVNSVKNIPYNILRMAYNIPLSYSRSDYSVMFINILEESGCELKDLKLQIDEKAIEHVGRRLKDNIDKFKIWTLNMMHIGMESDKILKFDIDNIEDTIPAVFPRWSEI